MCVSRSSDLLRVLKFLSNQDIKLQAIQIYKPLCLDRRKFQLIMKELIRHGFVIRDNGNPCGYKFNENFKEVK